MELDLEEKIKVESLGTTSNAKVIIDCLQSEITQYQRAVDIVKERIEWYIRNSHKCVKEEMDTAVAFWQMTEAHHLLNMAQAQAKITEIKSYWKIGWLYGV